MRVSRLALLSGRVLRDALTLLVQAIVLVLAGLGFGICAPLADVLIGLGFVAVDAASLSAILYTVGTAAQERVGAAPTGQHDRRTADAFCRASHCQ